MTPILRNTLLLSARAGWHVGFADPAIDASDALRLRRQPGSIRPLVDPSGSFGGLTEPTGLAIDAAGRIYILDAADAQIRRFDPCSGAFDTLPCVGGFGSEARQFASPHGIAICPRGDLFVADSGNHRVQRFALKGLALRAIITAPPAVADWEPWDVAVTRDGFFVSDYANGVVHRFNCHGRWEAAYDGSDADNPPFAHPTAVAVDRECRIYVIDEGSDAVVVLDAGGKRLASITKADQAEGEFCPTGIAVDPDGNLCIADASGALLISDGGGTPRTCRAWTSPSAPSALAFDHDGNPIVADADRQRICSVDANAAYETSGVFFSDALDSRIYNCSWHRVLLHATIGVGTRVRVDTFTSESLKGIDEIRALPESRWATRQSDDVVGSGEWDCLVLSPPGRYLWLRLTLIGSGSATPSIDSLRTFFPRASSLQYLPAVYSEEPVSRDFLGRFLSLFDTVRATVGDRVAAIETWFDPKSTPATKGDDFLSWLASWIGLALDSHWPEAKRRALVENAHELYKLRGTPDGLRLHIRLYMDREPQILEHYKLRRLLFLDQARLGDCSTLWGSAIVKRLQLDVYDQVGTFQLVDTGSPLTDPFDAYAHRFTVVVPLRAGEDEDLQRRTLQRIIELAKPAHTSGDLQVTDGRLRIGSQSHVGIDTIVGDYPAGVIEGTRRLGFDAVLGLSEDEANPPAMRVGVRTRIGATTVLR